MTDMTSIIPQSSHQPDSDESNSDSPQDSSSNDTCLKKNIPPLNKPPSNSSKGRPDHVTSSQLEEQMKKKQVDPSRFSEAGENLLHLVARLRLHSFIKPILKYYRNILDSKTRDNTHNPLVSDCTPIGICVIMGNYKGVQILCELSADLTLPCTNNKYTVFHLAVLHGDLDMLHCLLSKVDDLSFVLTLRDVHGHTFIHTLIENPKGIDWSIRRALLELLFDCYLEDLFTAQDNNNQSTLQFAKSKDEQVYKFLTELQSNYHDCVLNGKSIILEDRWFDNFDILTSVLQHYSERYTDHAGIFKLLISVIKIIDEKNLREKVSRILKSFETCKVISSSFFILAYCFQHQFIVHKDEEKATQMIRYSVDDQNAYAEYEYGIHLHAQKKSSEAYPYFLQSANQGFGPAHNLLGHFYLKGVHVEKNYEKAYEHFEIAHSKGVKDALPCLAFLHENGFAVQKDEQKSFEFYTNASKNGDAFADAKLGDYYFFGSERCEKNIDKAVEYYKLASDKGLRSAQYRLAMCYIQGSGVEKNEEEALKLLRLSAKQQYKHAQTALGRFHLQQKEYDEARKYLEEAANQGDTTACKELALIYSEGLGVSRDLQIAHQYMETAIKRKREDFDCNGHVVKRQRRF